LKISIPLQQIIHSSTNQKVKANETSKENLTQFPDAADVYNNVRATGDFRCNSQIVSNNS
jgi:hypothetical protein